MFKIPRTAELIDWWISKRDHGLGFVNIYSQNASLNDVLLIGRMKDETEEPVSLWVNSNRILKISKYGVSTDGGLFYPFSEAHGMYLKFLVEVNQANALHAYNWEFSSEDGEKNKVIAHVESPCGSVKSDVSFHVTALHESGGFPICGYSDELDGKVVFSSFAKKGLNLSSEAIEDIYASNDFHDVERTALIKFMNRVRKARAGM